MQVRAVAALREYDRQLASEHGEDTLWVACTHGDVIKAVIADAFGMHLDSFQRVITDPGSVSK
ncbi:histidine phosphatase family protein [Actinomadura welshii]